MLAEAAPQREDYGIGIIKMIFSSNMCVLLVSEFQASFVPFRH